MDVGHFDAPDIACQFALLAERGDWEEAFSIAQREIGAPAVGPELVIAISKILRNADMMVAAEAYLQHGRSLWSDYIWLDFHLAQMATDNRELVTAEARWRELMSRFPASPLGLCGLAALCRRSGREPEASALFRDASLRFPDYIWAADGNAMTATLAHDWTDAARLWSKICDAFPKHLRAHEQLARALLAAERFSDADEALRTGLSEFPDAGELLSATAQVNERLSTRQAAGGPSLAIADANYRCPTDLATTPTVLRRIMVIGSCLVQGMPAVFERASPGVSVDLMVFNNAAVLPEQPPHPPEEYDFQLLQIPLRSVIPEATYFKLKYNDTESYQRCFSEARDRMSRMLHEMMAWNRDFGLLTFVCNFLPPQQNPMGRLFDRYDLRNFVYFIERLNEELAREIKGYENTFLFDHDQLVTTFGRRNVQDDVLWTVSHASVLSDNDFLNDQSRLEPIQPVSSYYPTSPYNYVLRVWNELQALYRTVRKTDVVKLVLVDLDDTLWRGVVAEGGAEGPVREGWPLGFAETLLFLKQRGILLGVVSKNDEDLVLPLWRQIYHNLLTPDDFAVRKINWRPKADNIEEVLAELNLLPDSVVFIDDNPVERGSVKAAFPDMRVLSGNPYLWRRILLWAPEMQVPVITAESSKRTEMVQAQVHRETMRKQLTRAEFLASLELRVSVIELNSTTHPHFPRAIELINKTNQFNTTGRRWTAQEFGSLFSQGGRICAVSASDRYTAYGIIGVVVFQNDEVIQFVMSCRVVGMDVEIATISNVVNSIIRNGFGRVRASLIETPANLLCRDLWPRCGFLQSAPGSFAIDGSQPVNMPPHIKLDVEALPVLASA